MKLKQEEINHIIVVLEQVSIPSQRRYVAYWESILSVKRIGHGPIHVCAPQPCRRELRRIRLYDTVNVEAVFFVISQMQKVCLF